MFIAMSGKIMIVSLSFGLVDVAIVISAIFVVVSLWVIVIGRDWWMICCCSFIIEATVITYLSVTSLIIISRSIASRVI